MPVPILKLGSVLIVCMQAAMTDADLERLKEDLSGAVGRHRADGVVIDISALDVMDSFATRTLRNIADATRLRGATTVVVGMQPEVAFAMVQLGLMLDTVTTALDLEEGLALIEAQRPGAEGPEVERPGPGRPRAEA